MQFLVKILMVCFLCILTISLLYFIVVLAYSTLTEYNPDQKNQLEIQGLSKEILTDSMEISLLSWNHGYAGLGKEMDFFYEEGKMVRPTKELNATYLSGIQEFIIKNGSIDFLLFQEVDIDSKRSYYKNQYEIIRKLLPSHSSVFATNYKSWYVPIPLTEPMGKVLSGITTFSKFQTTDAHRIGTPGNHAWPKKLFMLKRCFICSKYEVSNGKELVIINLHNSAFDDESELRKAELAMLKEILISEYEKGNYVIAGGDWNQNPVGFKNTKFQKYLSKANWEIELDYLPVDWNWVSDPKTPTNRGVQFPFDINKTKTTILDYFVTSPNIEVIEVNTIDLEFENSDHHPVVVKVKLGLEN